MHKTKVLKETTTYYWKGNPEEVAANPDGLITSDTGGGGWTIYQQGPWYEVWLMLNSQASPSYPRWQTQGLGAVAYLKTPEEGILSKYLTTQWCDPGFDGRICNEWEIQGYKTESDMLSMTNGTVLDHNTWPTRNRGESKTIELDNDKLFQYYTIQMLGRFGSDSYNSIGTTKFYMKYMKEGTPDDYDFITEKTTYKVLSETDTKYWKYEGKTINGTGSGVGWAIDEDNDTFMNIGTASFQTPEILPLATANSWEIGLVARMTSSGTDPCFVGYTGTSDYKAPCLTFSYNTLRVFLSTTGDSWNLASSGDTGIVKEMNRTYYVKYGFTGSTYYVDLHLDGEDTYRRVWSMNSTAKVHCSVPHQFMGLNLNPSRYAVKGVLYLDDVYCKINGDMYWQAVKQDVVPGTPELKYWKYTTIANGYRLLDSIKGNGTQTLDTGIYPKDTTKVQSKFIYSTYSGGSFIGQGGTGEADSFRLFRHQNTTYLDYGSGEGYNRIRGTYLASTSYAYEVEFGNRYVKDIPTNTTKFSSSGVSFAQKNFTIQLTSQGDYGTFYYVKIFDGDTLVRDLVPCERASDGMVGMWDNVTNSFLEPSASCIKGDYVLIEGTPDDYDIIQPNWDFTTESHIYKALKVQYVPEHVWERPLTEDGTIGVSDFAVTSSGTNTYLLFDQNPDTDWVKTGAAGWWSEYIEFYIKEGVKLQSLDITNSTQGGTVGNGGAFIQASNDGSNWTDIASNTPIEGQTTAGATWRFNVNSDTTYTYFQMKMLGGSTLRLQEIKINAIQ